MNPTFVRPMSLIEHIEGSNVNVWECEVCGRKWACSSTPKCVCFDRKPVLSKSDFVLRYGAGEFGNASPTWRDLEAWEVDNKELTNDLYHIRNRIAGAETWYNVPATAVRSTWYEAIQDYRPNDLYISAMCPTHKTLINAEVMQAFPGSGAYGLQLYYSTVKKPMRDSLKEGGQQVAGLRAAMILRHYLDANSHDWLMFLLDAYPAHVIEFTTLSTKWGTLPNFNTIFWECRAY